MNEIGEIQRPVLAELQMFHEAFKDALQTENELLGEVLQHATRHQGKQLRPTLVLLAAKMGYGTNEKTIQTAVAIEMLHTASLIHDDVVDHSPLRRGLSSVQAEWNNKVAVLSGDYMLSKIMHNLVALKSAPIFSAIAELGMTLASGELLQLQSKDNVWITEKAYYQIIAQKTAALFATCAEVGAITGGVAKGGITALKKFGYHLGMAFQLKDDALDYSDLEDIGKQTMADIRDGKVTLPLLIAYQRAPEAEKAYIRQLVAGEISMEAEQEIKSFVLRFDGLRYTYQRMHYHQEEALKALTQLHPTLATQRIIESLEKLLAFSIKRMI